MTDNMYMCQGCPNSPPADGSTRCPECGKLLPSPFAGTTFEKLTERQMEVARLLCGGCKHSAIAAKLGISVKTVDTHRGHVMKKVGADNNVKLLILALRSGFIAFVDVGLVGIKSP